ncbi:GTPase IMAP family member 7 isoform X2 [Myripristis murdjan]|uniref:GTPase IMAP family member 7 isoform X2 n=1 Tax=Myripristis murdjan TaxID=586833 RepID=UPI001175E5A0|nr:GTPase IMAP family member 7-like isoform X2 [Myripristis murdjan]
MGSWNSPGNAGSNELKILLVGPRRTGKSSFGNTLLGQGQVFETRGGGASTAASGIIAGRHITVVDAQGWGSSEDSVPKQEKIELLRALDLCGPGGPHVILLVIPLLDFTEPERRALERRMEILTSWVWRHTMVLFTFGDWLKGRGRSLEQHIQSAGPALQWLMEKCRNKYYVVDNKMAVTAKKERAKETKESEKKEKWAWKRTEVEKGAERRNGGEADGKKEGCEEQVKELISKVEDMLLENGLWHFSLHMYRRLEEECSRREQELRARMEAERDEEKVRKTEGEEEDSLRKEEEKEEGGKEKMLKESLERWINLDRGREESQGRD